MNHKRTAIVTGASRGIGKATAIRLAQDFDWVVAVARNIEILQITAEEIREGLSPCLLFKICATTMPLNGW